MLTSVVLVGRTRAWVGHVVWYRERGSSSDGRLSVDFNKPEERKRCYVNRQGEEGFVYGNETMDFNEGKKKERKEEKIERAASSRGPRSCGREKEAKEQAAKSD